MNKSDVQRVPLTTQMGERRRRHITKKKNGRGKRTGSRDNCQFYAERSFVVPRPVLTSRRRRPPTTRGSITRPEETEHAPMSSVRSFCVFEVGSLSTRRSDKCLLFSPPKIVYPCNGVSATKGKEARLNKPRRITFFFPIPRKK